MDCRIHQKGVSCWLLAFGFWLLAQPANSQQLTAKSINWRDSLATLQKEIARQPWSTDLHLRKAAVNLELAQWQYAIDEYGLILERDVQNPAALYYRGYAHTQLRHYDMARRDYEELLSIFPRHTEARMALSYVLQLQGRQAEALDQLNQLRWTMSSPKWMSACSWGVRRKPAVSWTLPSNRASPVVSCCRGTKSVNVNILYS